MKFEKTNFISFLRKCRPLQVYFLVSIVLLFASFLQKGVPFRYDWSWPIFDLKLFWNGLTDTSLQGLFSALSKNGSAIFGLFGVIHFPPVIFLKLFILLVHFTAGYGFYRFIRNRVKSEAVAVISGLAYAFTPYIFIRTIVGFTWSMVAYAILPIFLLKYFQTRKGFLDYLTIGFLFSLIFCQTQAGLLTSLVITVCLMIALFGHHRVDAGKNYFLAYLSLFVFALPWLIIMLFKKQGLATVSGGAVTTLKYIADLPHSLRNVLFLSDHVITKDFFYPLAREPLFAAGYGLFLLVGIFSLLNKKNRQLVLSLLVSALLILPFTLGPTGIFASFYSAAFVRFPVIAVFRETYHFEFLLAFAEVVFFAFGLDFLWEKINSYKATNILKVGLKTFLAGSVIIVISPYFTFNYAGYFKLQEIPNQYYQLNNYLKENKETCKKIFYPPGFDFLYFKGDTSPDASNSDTIAWSIGIPYLNGGTSVLNTPSKEMFIQNELISLFYEKRDNGEFSAALSEAGIDCLIIRQDLDTKYWQASNMVKETDQKTLVKWKQNDWLAMAQSKQGLKLISQFGNSVYVYQIDNSQQSAAGRQLEVSTKNPPTANSQPLIYLPITDWATEFAYYKDGWSRGRYDFWRKHLFTQLRQDFIYTDKPDSILTGKVSQNGSYDLWIRYLTGGQAGEFEVKIQDTRYAIQKEPGEEKFIWRKIGDIITNGSASAEIKNNTGENAIADLVLLRK